VLRRFAPVLLLTSLVLAACGGSALTDPKDIVANGLDATGDLGSFHVSVAVTGNVIEPKSGTSITLDGTTLEGDVATSGSASLTFAVPLLLGLKGDLLLIDGDLYVKTTLTGAKWSHQALPFPSPDASDASASPGTDPKAMIAELRKFLAKDGVVTKKLDDVTCGDRQCYHVQVSIPSSLMADAGAKASMNPADIFGDALVIDLQFDKAKLWLTSASVSIDSAKIGTLSLTITLSAFDEPVTVSPPPADQVQEGGFNLPGLPGLPGLTLP
jgi:hypothetical protein